MKQTYEWLFDHWAEPILSELCDFGDAPLQARLAALPLEREARFQLQGTP